MSDPVQRLFAVMPNEYDNPIGTAARSVLLNHIRGHITGTFPRDKWVGEWSADSYPYRSWFCPHYSRRSAQSAIDNYWDNPTYWGELASAMLAQRIHHITHATADVLDRSAIDRAVSEKAPTINWWSFATYAAVARDSDTYATLLRDARAVPGAARQYGDVLTSDRWINGRITAYANGDWKQQGWELYHHWIKLHLLGASMQEVRQAVTTCIGKKLPVPAALAWRDWPTWWPAHAPWFTPFREDALSDLDQRITATRHVVAGMRPVSIPEFYAQQFCASGQPGGRWRR